jgi:hypothetical protein
LWLLFLILYYIDVTCTFALTTNSLLKQNRYDWMVYDLVIGGGCRGVHRWDDFAARFPSEQEQEDAEPTQKKKKKKKAQDTDWGKVGKSAAVLSVCATLVRNATLALPFNVAKLSGVDTRSAAFRAFLAVDGVAFISAAVATFCCTYAGFATADNVSRLSHLYFGASSLVSTSLPSPWG